MTTRQFVRTHPWLPWALAAGCMVLAAGFAAFGAGVLHGVMAGPDGAVRRWIVEYRSPASVAVANTVSTVGATQYLAVIAAIAGWALLRRGWWWVVLLILSAAVASQLVDLLKDAFDVSRPPTGVLVRESLSFPSGHTAGSTAICLFLGYVVARERRVRASLVAAVAIGVLVLVGVSRMFLDFHWLSDVLGGWIVGTAIAVGFCAIWEWTQRYQRDVAVSTNPEDVGATRT